MIWTTCRVASENMSTYSLYRRIVLSQGFIYIDSLQPYVIDSHYISPQSLGQRGLIWTVFHRSVLYTLSRLTSLTTYIYPLLLISRVHNSVGIITQEFCEVTWTNLNKISFSFQQSTVYGQTDLKLNLQLILWRRTFKNSGCEVPLLRGVWLYLLKKLVAAQHFIIFDYAKWNCQTPDLPKSKSLLKKSGVALYLGCCLVVCLYALTRDVKITRQCTKDGQTIKVRPGQC